MKTRFVPVEKDGDGLERSVTKKERIYVGVGGRNWVDSFRMEEITPGSREQ